MKVLYLFLAGLMQGVAFIMYPAAAVLLTTPQYQNLSPHEYGILFVPQIIAAILVSLTGGIFEKKLGHRSYLVFSLTCNALSMTLFTLTALYLSSHSACFVTLLFALTFLGLGFGAMLTILAPYMLRFFPNHAHSATAAIFAVVCLGATLSPLIFHSAVKGGLWWVTPLIAAGIFYCLIGLAYPLLHGKKEEDKLYPERKQAQASFRLPPLFWMFFFSMLLYGIAMTVYNNWGTLYMHRARHLSTATASIGLSLYWGFMLVGRAILIGGERFIPHRFSYFMMPILITISFLIIPIMKSEAANLFVFAFAGFAFSVTFPLTFSFVAQTFPQAQVTASGLITTAYVLGYGITAYGVGFLYDILDISLLPIFFYSFTVGLAMILLTFFIIRHPQVKE